MPVVVIVRRPFLTSAWKVSAGYVLAASLLLVAAVTEWALGIDAEGKSLESIADPLSS